MLQIIDTIATKPAIATIATPAVRGMLGSVPALGARA